MPGQQAAGFVDVARNGRLENLFVLFMHVYYIVAQTFVLRVDYWMNIISLVFLSAQFLLSGTQALDFMRGA